MAGKLIAHNVKFSAEFVRLALKVLILLEKYSDRAKARGACLLAHLWRNDPQQSHSLTNVSIPCYGAFGKIVSACLPLYVVNWLGVIDYALCICFIVAFNSQ